MKRIDELQHEYLIALLLSQAPQIATAVVEDKVNPMITTVGQALKQVHSLCRYRATMFLGVSV